MKKQIQTIISAFLLLIALAGTALVITDVITEKPEIAIQRQIEIDQTLSVLP